MPIANDAHSSPARRRGPVTARRADALRRRPAAPTRGRARGSVHRWWPSAITALLLALVAVMPAVAVTGPTRLSDPAVTPRATTPTVAIAFEVTYRNREGSPPDFVRVVIDGATHEMTGTGESWKTGVRFSFSTKLALGAHAVSFVAQDRDKFTDETSGGTVTVAWPPSPTPTPQPTAPPTPAPTPAPGPDPTPAASSPSGTPAPSAEPTAAPGDPSSTPGTTDPDPSGGAGSTPGTYPAGSTGDSWAGAEASRPGSSATGPGSPGSPDSGGASGPGASPGGTPRAGGSGSGGSVGGPTGGSGGSAAGVGWDGGGPDGPAPWIGGAWGTLDGTSGSGSGSSDPGGPGGSGAGTGVDGAPDPGGAPAPGEGDGRSDSGAATGSGRLDPATALANPPLAFATAVSALGLDGGLLGTLPGIQVAVVTSGGVALWMGFLTFGKRRRDGEPPEPDEILAAHAARSTQVAASSATAQAPVVPPPPFDPEAAMPRWRRPSLLQARKQDPTREPEAIAPRQTFARGAAEPDVRRERRLIRYRVVRLLDAPDEFRAAEIGVLDQGDEVELIERSGVYWLVRCPDASQGWIHKMTLGEEVGAPAATGPQRFGLATTREEELSAEGSLIGSFITGRTGA